MSVAPCTVNSRDGPTPHAPAADLTIDPPASSVTEIQLRRRVSLQQWLVAGAIVGPGLPSEIVLVALPEAMQAKGPVTATVGPSIRAIGRPTVLDSVPPLSHVSAALSFEAHRSVRTPYPNSNSLLGRLPWNVISTSRKTITAVLASVLALCLANEAKATPQLTFGPSSGIAYTAGQIGPPGHINFLSSGFTTPVFDGALIGSANWGPTSISGALITATSNFTLIGVESLTVSVGGKTATGNVSWTLDKDPPLSVNLLTGTWHITSSNLANFDAGGDNFLDATALGSGPDMVAFSQMHGAQELLTVSSGEAISSVLVGNGVPEPASLALLGAGLCGLGLIKRRHAETRCPTDVSTLTDGDLIALVSSNVASIMQRESRRRLASTEK